jgi:ATP-dependent RNA helicase RhlE
VTFPSVLTYPRSLPPGSRRSAIPTPPPSSAGHSAAPWPGATSLGLAQTGTGKTAAFVLPILQRLMQGPRKRVRALVVAPTRELAEQIHTTIVHPVGPADAPAQHRHLRRRGH